MPEQKYHLAQFSISMAKHPLDDPRMDGFVSRLQEINQLADCREGFVWRLQSESGDSTSFRGYDNPLTLLNLSLWDSLKSLREFVFKSNHSELYKSRRNWFHELHGPLTALWWVKEGHLPTIDEGVARLEAVKYLGSTEYAFGFKGACPPPEQGQPLSLIERCSKEVVDLHQYFQDWFRGNIKNTQVNQQRLMNSFDPLCELITPDGSLNSLVMLQGRFMDSYGQFPDAKVWISDFVPVHVSDERVLVKYKEWREFNGQSNVRVSSCLFTKDESAPNGVKWLYIHETWLKDANQATPSPMPVIVPTEKVEVAKLEEIV